MLSYSTTIAPIVFKSLPHFPRLVAGAGENAGDGWIRGREGEDCVIEVPAGTVAMDIQTGDMICDVDVENKLFLVQVL